MKTGITCLYLIFMAINGFHHHAVSLSEEAGFSPCGTPERNNSSSHDRDHCPVCIFSSSQELSESNVIVTLAGNVPVPQCDQAEQLIDNIVIGFYSPRAPPVFS